MFFIWVLLTCWIVYDHMNYEFPNFFFGTILVTIISNYSGRNGGHNWLPPSINDGRLDNFYCLLALLTLIDLGFYIVCAIRFRPNSTEIVPEMNGAIDTHLEEENL